jgi:hypothetical protein
MHQQHPVPHSLDRTLHWISRSFVFGAFIMAIVQFLNMRGLWTDESAVAINIVKRDYLGLMKPLDHLQVAPVLYLWIVKFLSQIFTEQEWGLRLYSLFSYFIALWLYWRLLRRFVKDEAALLVGIALFVFNNKLFYYADEVKQYMNDVMVTLALISLALDWRPDDRRSVINLSIAGLIGVFLSNITVMVLPTVFVACFLNGSKLWEKRRITALVVMSIPWLIAFIVNYILFIHGHPSRDQQVSLWKNFFPPADFLSSQMIFFIFNVFELVVRDFGFGVNNISSGFGFPQSFHLVIMAFLIAVFIYRVIRKGDRSWIFALPLVFHFILSYLRLYPLASRTMLYTYPFVSIMLAIGFGTMIEKIKKVRILIGVLLMAGGLTLCVMFISKFFPRTVEESRPVLTYIQAHSKPGIATYCYSSGISMLEYYIHIGFYKPAGPVFYARARTGASQDYVKEISGMNRDVWVYMAHYQPKHIIGIQQELTNKGYLITDSVKAKGVEAFYISRPSH